MKYFDCNDKELKKHDIIDIHQTVNGCSKFVVVSIDPLCIRYGYDLTRDYEYKYTGEFEIVGNVKSLIGMTISL